MIRAERKCGQMLPCGSAKMTDRELRMQRTNEPDRDSQ